MMKAYAMLRIGSSGWIEKERPVCGPMDAIVKPLAVAPCTSDIHTVWEGAIGEREDMILGHEGCGEVVEVGALVKSFKVGDRVLIPAITPDWNSLEAQAGFAMHSGGMLGGWKFSNFKDGVFAEYCHVNDADGNLALAALAAMPVGPGAPPAAAAAVAVAVAEKPLQALAELTEALGSPAFSALDGWNASGAAERAQAACAAYRTAASALAASHLLPGPTGESNRYRLLPRGAVWALPQTALGLVHQLAAALATGNACWLQAYEPGSAVSLALAALPAGVRERVQVRPADGLLTETTLSVLLFEGDGDALHALLPGLAQRQGALVRVENLTPAQLAGGASYDLSALVHEQSTSTNTAAAGGNAQLMAMG